jgi:nitrate reductase gamma subunit
VKYSKEVVLVEVILVLGISFKVHIFLKINNFLFFPFVRNSF